MEYYRMAGNFRGVLIFNIFVVDLAVTKISTQENYQTYGSSYFIYIPTPSHVGVCLAIVLVTSEPIVVSDNDPNPDINWWIQDLFLNQRDREVLQTGK
jgi:hypothetical protein